DHEVVGLAGVGRMIRQLEPPIANEMRDVERSIVAATHAGQCRRIVAWCVLGKLRRRDADMREQAARGNRPGADGDAVQEIASRDRPIHAQRAIAAGISIIVVRHGCTLARCVVPSMPRLSWRRDLLNRTHPIAVGTATPTINFSSKTETLVTSAVGRNAAARLTSVAANPT